MASSRSRRVSTSLDSSHSVFTHRSHRNQESITCPQCNQDGELPSSNSGDQIVVTGCQECHRNSQSSISRQHRRRPNSPTPRTRAVSLTPEPVDSSEPNQPLPRARNRGHNRSRSRSRQRRQRRRARRMAEAAAASASSNNQHTRHPTQNSSVTSAELTAPATPEEEAKRSQITQWPHNLSFLFACLTCTVGMFSISRFAILTIDFGLIFIIQFLLLSICFGIPLLAFHVSLGQYTGSGVIDVWRISPIHQGIGVALMIAQGLYGIYNIATISWLFVYFRDSFITAFDRYKWTTCFAGPNYGRSCEVETYNNTWKLEETLPDYYNGHVLLRSSPSYPHTFSGELRFQTLFHIIVIWMSVFIGLSKGLRSYGKVVYVFAIFPLVGFLVFSTKVIGLLPLATFKYWINSTHWLELLYNGNSWICAARECFFTWCMLGATISQLASHNKFKQKLFRDTTIIVIITFLVLLLSGVCGIAIVNLIRQSGYEYSVSSFGNII